MPAARASRATSTGSRPEVVAPSEIRTIAAGGRVLAARAERVERAGQRLARRGAALGAQRVERGADLVVLGGGAQHGVRAVRVADQPDLQPVGDRFEEPLAGVPGGVHPRGLDVGGVHGARGVGHEHHRRALVGHRDRRLGPRERDGQAGEREAQQRRRQDPAQAAAARQHGATVAAAGKRIT